MMAGRWVWRQLRGLPGSGQIGLAGRFNLLAERQKVPAAAASDNVSFGVRERRALF
jgi:hypothetical protein